jgi:hypothetical protein
VSAIAQIEAEFEKLSQAELREVRNRLDELIKDDLEFTPEFESIIQQSEHDMAAGTHSRIRKP